MPVSNSESVTRIAYNGISHQLVTLVKLGATPQLSLQFCFFLFEIDGQTDRQTGGLNRHFTAIFEPIQPTLSFNKKKGSFSAQSRHDDGGGVDSGGGDVCGV